MTEFWALVKSSVYVLTLHTKQMSTNTSWSIVVVDEIQNGKNHCTVSIFHHRV